MWIIIKVKKFSEINFIKKSLSNLCGSEVKLCHPKIQRSISQNFKKFYKESFLLDKYVLIYHNRFSDSNILGKLNYTRNIDYCLSGFKSCQKNIIDFVKNCEKYQDELGFVSSEFFKLEQGKNIKFSKGPFINFVSKIVEIQKKKLKLLVGDLTIYLDKKEKCLLPAE